MFPDEDKSPKFRNPVEPSSCIAIDIVAEVVNSVVRRANPGSHEKDEIGGLLP
jgi:hypothetical protein